MNWLKSDARLIYWIQKVIKVDIYRASGHANIKVNEEAERLAKDASCEAATSKVTKM